MLEAIVETIIKFEDEEINISVWESLNQILNQSNNSGEVDETSDSWIMMDEQLFYFICLVNKLKRKIIQF